MKKVAFNFDSIVNVLKNNALPASIGAGLGAAGLGLAGEHDATPEDDIKNPHRLRNNLLMGGLLGGAAGVGVNQLGNWSGPSTEQTPLNTAYGIPRAAVGHPLAMGGAAGGLVAGRELAANAGGLPFTKDFSMSGATKKIMEGLDKSDVPNNIFDPKFVTGTGMVEKARKLQESSPLNAGRFTANQFRALYDRLRPSPAQWDTQLESKLHRQLAPKAKVPVDPVYSKPLIDVNKLTSAELEKYLSPEDLKSLPDIRKGINADMYEQLRKVRAESLGSMANVKPTRGLGLLDWGVKKLPQKVQRILPDAVTGRNIPTYLDALSTPYEQLPLVFKRGPIAKGLGTAATVGGTDWLLNKFVAPVTDAAFQGPGWERQIR